MEKMHETCMFLCFHVNFNRKSTKHACFLVKYLSAYFYPPPPFHHNGKGSIRHSTDSHCRFPLLLQCSGNPSSSLSLSPAASNTGLPGVCE